MKRKPVIRRRRADEDIEDAIAFYLSEAGPDIATEFADRLEEAFAENFKTPCHRLPALWP